MPLDISDLFDADPEAEIKRRPNPNLGIDALMKGGYYDADKKAPVNLTEWLFVFNDPDNAEALAELFGGTPVEDEESPKDFNINLFSSAATVDGVVTEDSFKADMRQYNMGKLVHHCTGVSFLSHPMDDALIGTPCGCPRSFAERKKAAAAGLGPSPYIDITFKLPQDDEFTVKFHTGSWGLLRNLPSLVNAVIAAGKGGEAVVTFGKKVIQTQRGEAIVPTVDVVSAYNDAIAA
jgi:hypothetical protein